MVFQFKRHYTREEAQALLPQVRLWLQYLTQLRKRLSEYDERLTAMLSGGNDIGGAKVNRWVEALGEMKNVLSEFQKRDIQIKDLDRGLIDFPAIIGGKEVFLCWEQDEDAIEFWHDLASGYAGRERL